MLLSFHKYSLDYMIAFIVIHLHIFNDNIIKLIWHKRRETSNPSQLQMYHLGWHNRGQFLVVDSNLYTSHCCIEVFCSEEWPKVWCINQIYNINFKLGLNWIKLSEYETASVQYKSNFIEMKTVLSTFLSFWVQFSITDKMETWRDI